MKTIKKGNAPTSLSVYLSKYPHHSWNTTRHNKKNNGNIVIKECRKTCIDEQGGICCYCECSLDRPDIDAFCRVEHFHQKSDSSQSKNWDLDWQNMFASCNGKTNQNSAQQMTLTQARNQYPHPENLSCDAHKNHKIQTGNLQIQCEGILVNPLDLPPFPNLFKISLSGRLLPNCKTCSQVTIPRNNFPTTQELIQNSIDLLNLNCDRLCHERKRVLHFIDKYIEKGRLNGKKPEEVYLSLIQLFFHKRWPEYFTTIRCRLGEYAEKYLRSISFKG